MNIVYLKIEYCKSNIPQHFFNILYENVDMFKVEVNNELFLLNQPI